MKQTYYFRLACLWMALIFITGFAFQGKKTDNIIGLGWAKNAVNTVIFRKNAVFTHQQTQYSAFYDSSGYVVVAKRKLPSYTWQTKQSTYTGNVQDAHNSISIITDGDGYLHVAWDHHGNPLRYCKSTKPGSLELTEKMSMIGKEEENVTYPEFYRLPNGNLIFLYRNGASGQGNLVMNLYELKTKTWKRLHNSLIDGEGQRNAYWQATVDQAGTIHVSWVWRESPDVASNHDLCYARSKDGGQTWQKSNGEVYQMPITAANAEYTAHIPEKSELINQTSMYADGQGRPYIATYWRPANSTIPQYHVVYYDGTTWLTQQASQRQTPFSLSGMGTKKIPISRPQILVDTKAGKTKAYLVYRDAERNNRISVNVCPDLQSKHWTTQDLTSYSVGNWEPSYDPIVWQHSQTLHLFVQKVGQGDGETLENIAAQPVSVLEWKPTF